MGILACSQEDHRVPYLYPVTTSEWRGSGFHGLQGWVL